MPSLQLPSLQCRRTRLCATRPPSTPCPPAQRRRTTCPWVAGLLARPSRWWSTWNKVSAAATSSWCFCFQLSPVCLRPSVCPPVLAIELLAACQALEFLRPLETTTPLEKVYELLRSVVRSGLVRFALKMQRLDPLGWCNCVCVSSPWDRDRVMSTDIQAAHGLIREQKAGPPERLVTRGGHQVVVTLSLLLLLRCGEQLSRTWTCTGGTRTLETSRTVFGKCDVIWIAINKDDLMTNVNALFKLPCWCSSPRLPPPGNEILLLHAVLLSSFSPVFLLANPSSQRLHPDHYILLLLPEELRVFPTPCCAE